MTSVMPRPLRTPHLPGVIQGKEQRQRQMIAQFDRLVARMAVANYAGCNMAGSW